MVTSTFSLNFKPCEFTTVDEMLSLYRGRCPVKVFMKEKPGKYGILIRMLTDSHKRYVLDMEPYAGKSNEVSNKPKDIVRRLAKSIKGTSRNITMDRFYSSVELADELWDEFQLTVVGTMLINRKHIPEIMKIGKDRELYSSMFLFSKVTPTTAPVTLLSYCHKPKKVLIFVSTQHQTIGDFEGEKKKSEINTFYNNTKGGVDTIDQLARCYTTKRGSFRWPMSIFYTLLDTVGVNAYTLFIECVPDWERKNVNRRRLFRRELALSLVKPYVSQRNTSNLHKDVGLGVYSILHEKTSSTNSSSPSSVVTTIRAAATTKITPATTTQSMAMNRGRCRICYDKALDYASKQKASRISTKCYKCGIYVWKVHSCVNVVCEMCGENSNMSD